MAYGTGRIQFISNDRSGEPRNYSDRSIIQLVEQNFPNADLRARDVDSNGREIFNIPLRRRDQYNRGGSADNPDEIHDNRGTYRLWLNAGSRDAFHQGLDMYFQQLALCEQPTTNPPPPRQQNNNAENYVPRNATTDDYQPQPPRNVQAERTPISPKDLIHDVHQLGEFIEQGDTQAAGEKAAQLASQNIRLQRKPCENARKEQKFQIRVQIDGNDYGIDRDGGTIPIDVFQSTTVRELRATFEQSHKFIPTNQYYFVNGHLAHDNSTMQDLKVGPDSLFVLFYLRHAKNNRPWRCAACNTNNKAMDLHCHQCRATPRN